MIYHFGDCVLDTNLYTLERGGQEFRLRLKVFRMCLYLVEHRDRVISREELCTQVWPGQFVSQATLEGVIRLVRQAVGDSGRTQNIIQTLHGHGYRFVAHVEEPPPADTPARAERTVAFPSTVEVAVPPEDVKDLTEIEDGHAQEASLAAGLPDGTWQGPSAAIGDDIDKGEMLFPGKPWSGRPQSGWRWWLPRLGVALVLITLVVLGGWAVSWAVRAHGTDRLHKSRIAVLPFIDLRPEADQSYVADGLTENLIAELARAPGLMVIARTSVMKYKGHSKDVATIGRELRVGTIVEGTIRRIDNQVRINAQLIDVASQGHLWSQDYDLELTNIFGIRSDIANRITQWLNVPGPADSVSDCLQAEPKSTALVQQSRSAH